MGENTKIEWCHHTFNPWRGCAKVSAGCEHCYAETLSKRNPAVLGIWGPNGTRVVASEATWRDPVKWDRAAALAGERRRVFCASLADVFEHRPDLVEPRNRLFRLIDSTPFLDWLLLTKRPENVTRLWPENPNIDVDDEGVPYHIHVEGFDCEGCENDCCWGTGGLPSQPYPLPSRSWRPNVWLMTSVESAEQLERIDTLQSCGALAPVLGLSVEPLLGPIPTLGEHLDGIDWVIVGGESGHKARPCFFDWIRSIRDQCAAAGTPLFIKQMGSRTLGSWPGYNGVLFSDGRWFWEHSKGGDPAEWPADLRVREFPTTVMQGATP